MNGQNPSNPASTGPRSPAAAMVDSVIRKALRISDPRNADEVARGLLARYPDDAARIKRERMGLPFSVYAAQPVAPTHTGRPEATAALTALDAALTRLTTDPDLADIAPELRGWSSIIRRAAADGIGAAGSALDPGERDRAFAARRILGDYARLSRYAGALTSCAPDVYCRVAQACDDVANIILVIIGDALGDAGITRTGAVLQAPASVLQARRESVIAALRNLAQPMTGDSDDSWPRGAQALFQLYDALDQAGAPDLRAFLDEGYLSSQLDELVDMASGFSPDGLRGLAAASAGTVARLQRFLIVASGIIQPASPPATMFFVELQLFMQGFASGNIGYRLPYLARSPLLVSAFAASAGIDAPTQRLLSLALSRTAFADAVDCLCCLCDTHAAVDMVLAGKVLSDIDRAIDLYALGTDRNGLGGAEWRAALYGATIAAAIPRFRNPVLAAAPTVPVDGPGSLALKSIVAQVQWDGILANPAPLTSAQLVNVIDTQINDEVSWSDLVSTVAPLCRQDLLFRLGGTDPIAKLFTTAGTSINNGLRNAGTVFPDIGGPFTGTLVFGPKAPTFNVPRSPSTSLDRIAPP
jgi:hypothetical protein